MTLSRYTDTNDNSTSTSTSNNNSTAEPGRLNISLEDARTLKALADAALEQDVRDPEYVAARAAVEIDVDDAAVTTVAAAEAMGRTPPQWARRGLRGGDSQ